MLPDVIGVSADWSPDLEAKFFVNLVLLGKITVEQAEKDILMTETQRAWLLDALPFEALLTDRIFCRRRQTWACFVERLRKASNMESRSNH